MKITVFTPTYNRAYVIEGLYRSLQRQTFHDFEWLVVDDGSSDQTEEVIREWQSAENPFEIRYARKENGGKCSAINLGLDLARGELFFTVDSDDYLTEDALEKVSAWEAALPKEQRFCGVAGNLGTSKKSTPNTPLGTPYYDGTVLDRYRGIDGERAMVFYTEIHRQYRYPTFEGETFMTEAVAWNRMAADGYRIRYYDDIIWIYEYREDGLTRAGSSVFLDNPRGYGLWLRERARFLHESKINRLKMVYTFACDLSGRYTAREIASFIGASERTVSIALATHRLKRLCGEAGKSRRGRSDNSA
ncbi:MAG: glycosyltransferase family 2 protein [Clostridiales bacterium]|nr:glycosyltransferase family 2 protein [Clostridiales bacterium]MDY5514888.1 glycosyltransferase family 2 protein [Candidatus Ventricola sp.]